MSPPKMPSMELLERWLEKQRKRDPELFKKLQAKRLALGEQPELLTDGAGPDLLPEAAPLLPPDIILETIVRDGRPALFVESGTFTTTGLDLDPSSSEIVQRLDAARATVNPAIPLVGRIDVTNHASGLDFLGTGWLVAEDVIVTNRHVAELLAVRGPTRYEFVTGRFGDPISASVGYGHELGGKDEPSAKIEEVLYIEPPGPGPDIAFIRIAGSADGTTPKFIELSDTDPKTGDDVVVIGYPARAPAWTIPDQQRMDQLYGGVYDVKRAAPGKIDDESRGWTTHDCTTLGGNSGSVVLELATGKACALHFAGLYLVENYAVPASTIRKLRDNRPPYRVKETDGGQARPAPAAGAIQASAGGLPITITISIAGAPAISSQGTAQSEPEAAASSLGSSSVTEGVMAVRPGLLVENDALVDRPCLVVAAQPGKEELVRRALPQTYLGFPVQVRTASLNDQLGFAALTEAPRRISYDDDARSSPDFRLDWVKEPMKLTLHVGPDCGFPLLKQFLADAKTELVSAIYQFYAEHIRAALAVPLASETVEMTLVADPQTRDQKAEVPPDQFDRADAFAHWSATNRFRNIYVPEGNGGLVDNAYHIKVTVKDGSHVWLSSGNWTKTSQPDIAPDDAANPSRVSNSGNREWHVIADSPTLAKRFREHIVQDFATSGSLGGRPESLESDLYVDVPEAMLETVDLEAAPARLFEPLELDGDIRVKPLLTPDHQGGIYCDAVLELIASAKTSLLFQNQYINVLASSTGRFAALVDALAAAANRLEDCRIILRADGTGFWDNIAELRRRGIDVGAQVRRLANTHTKGIIIDHAQVLVGSHNWSQSGVTSNRDASLIIDDVRAAGYFGEVFEVDWARANRLVEPRAKVPEAVRIATGEAPPAGYRRISLADYLEG